MAAQRQKGRLYLNPTDLTAHDTNYGGVDLGAISGLYVMPNRELVSTQGVETGYPDQYFIKNGIALVGVNFREPNLNVMQLLFPATAGTNSFPLVSAPGTAVTGTSAWSNKLLFVSEWRNTQQSWIFYKAFAQLEPTQQIRASALRETTYPVIFEAVPDGSNRLYQAGLLQDLTL